LLPSEYKGAISHRLNKKPIFDSYFYLTVSNKKVLILKGTLRWRRAFFWKINLFFSTAFVACVKRLLNLLNKYFKSPQIKEGQANILRQGTDDSNKNKTKL